MLIQLVARWGIGGGCEINMIDVIDVAVNAERHVVAL